MLLNAHRFIQYILFINNNPSNNKAISRNDSSLCFYYYLWMMHLDTKQCNCSVLLLFFGFRKIGFSLNVILQNLWESDVGRNFFKLFLKKELIPCLVFLGIFGGCNVRKIPGVTRNLEKLYEKQFQEINFFHTLP